VAWGSHPFQSLQIIGSKTIYCNNEGKKTNKTINRD
jgi:hypothetical protein